MRKYSIFFIICSFIPLFLFSGCDQEDEVPPITNGGIMTMSANIELLKPEDNLLLANDSISELALTFSEPIDESSIEKSIVIKAFVRGASEPLVFSPEVVRKEGEANTLQLKLPKIKWFSPHTLFQLQVSTGLRSTTGSTLGKEEGGFFYVGATSSFDYGLVESSSDSKKAIVVVSDIHMGDQRSQDGGYGWFKDNKQLFVDFLDHLIANSYLVDKLVIAGDFMDEWVVPMSVETFGDEAGNRISQHEFVGKIIAANQDVVDKMKALRQSGMEIVYIPGNHDMLVTTKDFDQYFGKGVITQARDSRGMGRYEPSEDLVIEHGHRYDYFNSPDPFSNKGIDEVGENSILPPGFFVSRIASSSDLETPVVRTGKVEIPAFTPEGNSYTGDEKNWQEMAIAWPLILMTKPVHEEISGKYIKTGIDGFTRDYTIEEVGDWHIGGDPSKWRKPVLYNTSYQAGIWTNRLKANGVLNVDKVPFEIGLLSGVINSTYKLLANNQYIEGLAKPKRIVVFGHTHEATIVNIGSSVYANSGTWVDKKWASKVPERTFIVIQDYLDANKKGSKEVSLFSFGGKEEITKIGKTYCLRYK